VNASPEMRTLLSLAPDETILRTWASPKSAEGPLSFVLTSQRIIVLRGTLSGSGTSGQDLAILASRRLESIAEPHVRMARPRGVFSIPVLDVAGFESFGGASTGSKAELSAIAAAISAQRQFAISARLPAPHGSGAGTHRPAEVITREVVKVPCPKCHGLVDYARGICDTCGTSVRE